MQDVAPDQHGAEHHESEQAGCRQRAAPAHQRGHRDHAGRRQHEADIAGEGVDAERPAEPGAVDRRAQDGIIGRMEHAVADAGHRHQDQHQPVAGGKAQRGHGGAHHRQPQQQEPARAEAVDQEARRHLGEPGRHVEHSDQQAERCVAHVELLAQEGEQGRQGQQIEVTHGMARAYQGENLNVAPYHPRTSPLASWIGTVDGRSGPAHIFDDCREWRIACQP